MIPTCNGFKACWLKSKMLLSSIFGFDTLNLTKDKFTGHELGVCYKKHSSTKFSGKILRLTKIPFNTALVTASVYLMIHSIVFE